MACGGNESISIWLRYRDVYVCVCLHTHICMDPYACMFGRGVHV